MSACGGREHSASSRRRWRRRVVVPSATLSLPLVLSACGSGVLDPKGPVGAAELTILIDSLAIMLAIVVPTIAATLGFAWWFRAGNKRARYRPDWEFSGQIELLVWSVPLMTIMLLGGVAWIGSHALDPARELPSDGPPLEVQVASLDWKWLFIYPDRQVAAVNELVIPAGVAGPIHPDLGQRDERVLHPRARQHALFDERNGERAEPAGGRARHLPGALDPLQRGRIFGHDLFGAGGLGGRVRRVARSDGGELPDQPSTRELCAARRTEQRRRPVHLPRRRSRFVSSDRHAGPAARARADGRDQSWRRQASGELACWAS